MLKLKMIVGEHEFEAEGTEVVVLQRYREWRRMLRRQHGIPIDI